MSFIAAAGLRGRRFGRVRLQLPDFVDDAIGRALRRRGREIDVDGDARAERKRAERRGDDRRRCCGACSALLLHDGLNVVLRNALQALDELAPVDRAIVADDRNRRDAAAL